MHNVSTNTQVKHARRGRDVGQRPRGATLRDTGSRPGSQRPAKCRHCDHVAPCASDLRRHVWKAHRAAFCAFAKARRRYLAEWERRLRDLERIAAMAGVTEGDVDGEYEDAD